MLRMQMVSDGLRPQMSRMQMIADIWSTQIPQIQILTDFLHGPIKLAGCGRVWTIRVKLYFI